MTIKAIQFGPDGVVMAIRDIGPDWGGVNASLPFGWVERNETAAVQTSLLNGTKKINPADITGALL